MTDSIKFFSPFNRAISLFAENMFDTMEAVAASMVDEYAEKLFRGECRMHRTDLILLHPPSVFKFRELPLFFGPVSDVVPSSSIFEIYPIGFLTMSQYLHTHGLSVRIVNLALKMLRTATSIRNRSSSQTEADRLRHRPPLAPPRGRQPEPCRALSKSTIPTSRSSWAA